MGHFAFQEPPLEEIPISAMKLLWGRAKYTPHAEQEPIHAALSTPGGTPEIPAPRAVVVGGGIQAGKSVMSGNHILGRFMFDEITWLVGRRYKDCEKEYQYCRDAAVAAGYAKKEDCSYAVDGPWEMKFLNGHVLKTLSSDDTTRLASEAPDGIIMCEPGRQTREAFETCWERVVPKSGYLAVVGTFERSAGWYRSLWREFQGPNTYGGISMSLPSYSNRHFYPQGQNDPKFQAELTRAKNDPVGWDRFQERFLGIPRIPHDMVFYEFSRPLHVSSHAEYQPGVEVQIAIDPGFYPSAAVVLFIQVVQGQVRVFDEIYVHKVLRKDVITMVEQHFSFPYITRGVIDPYGGSQHGMGAESAEEEWQQRLAPRGIRVVQAPRRSVDDRIGRVHDYLHQNPLLGAAGLLFAPRVKQTVLEFEGWIDDEGHERGYRYPMTSDGRVTSDTPIPQDDHAVSCIGYFLIEQFGFTDIKRVMPKNVAGRSSFGKLDRNPYGGRSLAGVRR